MATANTSERNQRATDWSARYGDSSITFRESSTVLVTHTVAGFGAPSTGVLTANSIADATIASTGTADNVLITDNGNTYTLTVGTSGSGADVIVSNPNYVAGEISSITAMTVTFPAT